MPEALTLLYSKERQRSTRVAYQGSYVYGSIGSVNWMNPESPYDCALWLRDTVPEHYTECDYLPLLAMMRPPFSHSLVYQNWRLSDQDGIRLYGASLPAELAELGKVLRESDVRELLLLAGGFMPGSIRALAENLSGHNLDYLGLGWVFTGDDITDKPSYPNEIAFAVKELGVKRLCLITAVFNDKVESALFDALEGESVEVGVFGQESGEIYPRYLTPLLDRLKPSQRLSR